jgi:hypothetical protein
MNLTSAARRIPRTSLRRSCPARAAADRSRRPVPGKGTSGQRSVALRRGCRRNPSGYAASLRGGTAATSGARFGPELPVVVHLAEPGGMGCPVASATSRRAICATASGQRESLRKSSAAVTRPGGRRQQLLAVGAIRRLPRRLALAPRAHQMAVISTTGRVLTSSPGQPAALTARRRRSTTRRRRPRT